jgi:hypothetical protein
MCCSAAGAGYGVHSIRAEQREAPLMKPLTPTLSQREREERAQQLRMPAWR